jgi:group I intron endonuclease
MGYVYKITNMQTKKSYVGKTIKMHVKERFYEHVSNARKIEGSSMIAKSLREYGTINHTIEILESCEDNLLLEREQY